MASAEGMIFKPRLRRMILVCCILSVLATTASLLYGSSLVLPPPKGSDSYDRGPLGHRAFFETLQKLELGAIRHREAARSLIDYPVLFIEPERYQRPGPGLSLDLITTIQRRDLAGKKSVLVLSKWSYDERVEDPVAIPDDSDQARSLLKRVLPGAKVKRSGKPDESAMLWTMEGKLGFFQLEIPWLQTMSLPENAQVLLGSRKEALVAASESGNVIIVSDPSIFHNVSFFRADHPRLWWEILGYAGVRDTVVIDEVFHGHLRSHTLGEALGTFPAVLIVIQLLFLGLVIVAAGTVRFGVPRPPPPPYEPGPKEVVRIAASVLTDGQPPALLSEAYIERIIEEIAEKLNLEEEGGMKKIAENIDAVLAGRGKSRRAVELLNNIQNLASFHPEDLEESLNLARKAWFLRKNLLGSSSGIKAQPNNRKNT